MGPFQRRRGTRDQSADSAAFQWDYTPGEGDAGAQYMLLGEQDGTMDDDASRFALDEAVESSSDKPDSSVSAPKSVYAPNAPRSRVESQTSGIGAALVPAADSPQTRYLRYSLDTALDRWRAYDEPPSAALTRRGLEALIDGTDLSPDQRSLLLRAALYHGSGILTALQHQDDTELTAIIIAEALTTSRRPIASEAVLVMRDRDVQGDVWFGLLLHELRYATSGSDVRIRRRAVDALWRLQGEYAVAPVARSEPAVVRPGLSAETAQEERRLWRGLFVALAITLAVVATALFAWYLMRDSAQLVSLPAGQYVLPRDGTLRRVGTTGFAIQRFEVKNQDYRRCVTSGRCSAPGASALSGIGAYYNDRAYSDYPVVNVTYGQAAEYCDAQGMRLPSAAEWSLAAGAAPSTGEMLTYPWGNTHEVQRANTLESGLGGPTQVGSFSPAGDSPIGAADMGGNVAEWTMSTGDSGVTRVVKGGSYRQSADAARVESEYDIAAAGIGDWIGFRCVQAQASE